MSTHVLSIFGTRPEAVKMAPVVKELEKSESIKSTVCVTGQHREMLDQVLDVFGVTPDIDLNLMRNNQTLSQLSSNIMTGVDKVLAEVKPDWVLIQGDTTTVMISALVAFYKGIQVGHVEAGLRTGNKRQPFPEEVNRKIAGVLADIHFAPTEHSKNNLIGEGVPEESVFVTGNTVVDALHWIGTQKPPQKVKAFLDRVGVTSGSKKLVLVTAHRRENFGKPLENICTAIKQLAENYNNLLFVYPVHLNPNVHNVAYKILSGIKNIHLIPPAEYLDMVYLLKNAHLVLTDSGGIQEEATALNVPTLVLRNVTERPEGVEAGVLKLVGDNTENIEKHASNILENTNVYQQMQTKTNPFGDGNAAKMIVSLLLKGK